MNKEQFLDMDGKPMTQSLFLELGYTDKSIYTLKEFDYEYKGHIYPSIKQLYLNSDDPTEYKFANECFLSWKHWMRICENKVIRKYVDEWREELEIKLRSRAIRQAMESAEQGSFQSAKWLADRGWNSKGAGRPSKEDINKEKAIQARIADEYEQDVIRLVK